MASANNFAMVDAIVVGWGWRLIFLVPHIRALSKSIVGAQGLQSSTDAAGGAILGFAEG
jgi:hypothetical protein